MELPDPAASVRLPAGLELMPHQAQGADRGGRWAPDVPAGRRARARKDGEALLAAQAANAYPLLCVVPNVVKTNWAREAALWTPSRSVTVIHGSGEAIDGFADIVIVNYEVLDRHVGWIATHRFRGMVVDEAHFIKNKKSQRSQHVLEIADHIRQRVTRPLMMALTGTPLINDIDDFRAIWQFLGWIGEKTVGRPLMAALEETGVTPLEHGFYPAARQAVIDLGIVRRRKVDVADEIPARRIADLPVELDAAAVRSIREAERGLALRLVQRYDSAVAARAERSGETVEGIDHELVRRVAGWERSDSDDCPRVRTSSRWSVGSVQAKAALAADYAAQLAHSTGKVVFFAKHIDVMDAASELFESRGIGFSSIRGDQTSVVRQRNIDAFTNDPDIVDRGLLPDRSRSRAEPPGREQRGAGRALVDRRRADPGDRPGPPDRPDRARHGLADHRRPDDRRQDRRADRLQGGSGCAGARRLRRGGRLLRRHPARGTGGHADGGTDRAGNDSAQ